MAKDCESSKPYRLSDTFGLQVMVAALFQLTGFEIDRNQGRLGQDKFYDLQYDMEKYFDAITYYVDSPINAAEVALNVTLKDFQFSAAELFKYQRLVWFVSDDRPDMWPLVDRETPIARHKELAHFGFLFELVDDWMNWLVERESAPKPDDPSWYFADVKFMVFQHFTRKLWGGGAGNLINSKIRTFDCIRDAASFAIQLMNGRGLSEDAAICKALKKYPRIYPGDAKELNFRHIVSTSDAAADKRVEREIKKIKAEIKAENERRLAK